MENLISLEAIAIYASRSIQEVKEKQKQCRAKKWRNADAVPLRHALIISVAAFLDCTYRHAEDIMYRYQRTLKHEN